MANTKKETVYLRRRQRGKGTASLYLDMCRDGKRTNEYLHLYLVPEHSRADRQKNKETLKLAEAIRAKRIIEIQAKDLGFGTPTLKNARFFDVMRTIADSKNGTTKTSWLNCIAHIHRYEHNEAITFADISPQWVRGFRDYLDKSATQWAIDPRKHDVRSQPLSQGTKALMFQKLCSAFNTAMREGIISTNPAAGIKRFREPESDRQFLTIDEMRRLRDVPPPNPVVARAFFFSCLTGLRWSDIAKLRWSEIHDWKSGTRVVFTQKKTRSLEYLDLNKQAAAMLGTRGEPSSLVFRQLGTIQAARIAIAAWVRAAGIDKHITFHCARHSFAVMMLDLGADIYTVSKLLGHKSIETTQIYAKILDKNKKAAVDRIPDIFSPGSK